MTTPISPTTLSHLELVQVGPRAGDAETIPQCVVAASLALVEGQGERSLGILSLEPQFVIDAAFLFDSPRPVRT